MVTTNRPAPFVFGRIMFTLVRSRLNSFVKVCHPCVYSGFLFKINKFYIAWTYESYDSLRTCPTLTAGFCLLFCIAFLKNCLPVLIIEETWLVYDLLIYFGRSDTSQTSIGSNPYPLQLSSLASLNTLICFAHIAGKWNETGCIPFSIDPHRIRSCGVELLRITLLLNWNGHKFNHLNAGTFRSDAWLFFSSIL